ncbi:alpha/beta fold hydrolase [Nocardia amamiensis]|uniref:alpha/beta fold hydrolase n=1 Tax=Nocardia amamiensis TaxID=404578 RepID=UPI000834990C|nr:alpha/beta hydrolase [Nocardia amamiensis]
MQDLTILEHGTGPAVALVHGGSGPKTTWTGLHALSARWTLLLVHRRGFGAGPPPPGGRQDFEIDADDLEAIFRDRRPHVVAHSYGVLGALLAAARAPWTVRSLTLIEPPLYFLAPDDPEVARLEMLGNTVLTDGLDADPAILREFLTLAGAPDTEGIRLSDRAIRRAWGARLPGQARPNLTAVRAAGIPALVASGGHSPGLERICDLLADALGAQRLIAPGAGHFVPAAPDFADRLEDFLSSAIAR